MNKHQYSKMTLNNRLYTAQLLDDFDDATQERDQHRMMEILKSVEFSKEKAKQTTESILKKLIIYGD